MNQHKKAVIYCRVSTKEQVEGGNSLVSQERICRKYERGLTTIWEKYSLKWAKVPKPPIERSSKGSFLFARKRTMASMPSLYTR